jgi:O-antigen ligase
MPLIRPASGAQRVFIASAAAFLLVAPFPRSAGWRVFFILVACAALAWQAWRREETMGLARVPRPLAVAAAAWIALCAASLAWSVDAQYTLQELRREILYGAIAFVVFFAGTRTSALLHLWMKTLFIGGLLLGIGEWLRFVLPGIQWARDVSMGPGPFSTHVLILAPLLVLFLWRAPVGLARSVAFTLGMGVTLVAAGIAGDSRILWIALLVAAVVAFAVFWRETPAQHPSRIGARRALLVALVALPVLMMAAADYKLRYYPGAASTIESFSIDERPLIWKLATRDAAERPWAGYGYGREIIGARLREELVEAGQPKPYNHGHNVFLDAVLQMGVLGLVAFVLLMAALAEAFLRTRKRDGGVPLAIVGLAMLAGYLTKDLTDDFFFRPNSLVFWSIAGMLLGLAARLPEKS